MTTRLALVVVVGLLGIARGRGAAAADGQQIFQEVAARDAGYGTYKASVTMLLKEKSGSTSVRKLEIASKETKGDGARVLIVFNSPADVKGTKVLTASHVGKSDEQWIYLPAFSRVKQISTANQSAAFMGSEFSYEDLASINIQVAKFTYQYLKEETLDGAPCFVVERRPTYEKSAYLRQVAWIDEKDYVIKRVEYYDQDARPMKILRTSGYQKYLERHLRPAEMVMENPRTGSATVLQWEQYKFQGSGVSDGDFDLGALKR